MSKQILLVDDDAEVRSVVATTLQQAGYEVFTATDASEAMARAEEANFGLIILDMNLAGESGFALMKYLKRNHPVPRIIVYTGEEHDYEQVAVMLQQGAHRYVRKGTMVELVEAVRASFP